MAFKCFKCLKSFGGIQSLFFHFKHSHQIRYGRGVHVTCFQKQCRSHFNTLGGFKKHLISKHSRERNNDGQTNVDVNNQTLYEEEATHHSEEQDTEEIVIEGGDGEKKTPHANEAALLIAKLRNSSRVPTSFVEEVLENVEEIFDNFVDHIQEKITKAAENVTDEAAKVELEQLLNETSNPFSDLKTEHQKRAYFKKCGAFISPEQKILGHYFKPTIDSSSGTSLQVRHEETFQYISISQSLKQHLEQPGVLEAIHSAQESEDQVLKSYRDGDHFKENHLHEESLVIPLLLYSDDFETANPLGSKRGKHKICAFYMSVLSLPPVYQARLDNILLVALATTKSCTKYGMDSILKTICSDLKDLSDNGLHIKHDGRTVKVKPVLFQVTGDNLGINSMLGYTLSFSANYYCRLCKGHRAVLQSQTAEDKDLLRTRESYEEDIGKPLSDTGISRRSILNDLDNYHVTLNLCVDVMHDFAEGVIPLEMYLVLGRLIEERCFNLEELNARIQSYNYGFANRKNRPSPVKLSVITNPSGPSGQSAAQMMCLAYHLPLIIGDKVPEDSEEWELYLQLINILKTVMAPSVSKAATFALKALICEHHRQFLRLFPERNLTPKQHFLTHYPRVLRALGPLCQYSSIRFEGKHKVFKAIANSSCNFKNIAKTLSEKHQMARCYAFLSEQSIQCKDLELSQQLDINLSSLAVGNKISDVLQCDKDIVVSTSRMAVIHGYEYRAGTCVITQWTEDGPTFGKVLHVLLMNSEVLLVLKMFETVNFSSHFQAYAVHEDGDKQSNIAVVKPCKLFDYHPLMATQIHKVHFEEDTRYIAVRFNFL